MARRIGRDRHQHRREQGCKKGQTHGGFSTGRHNARPIMDQPCHRTGDPMLNWRVSFAKESKRRRISAAGRSEEHTSELQSLMRISYAVFCLKKKNKKQIMYIITIERT